MEVFYDDPHLRDLLSSDRALRAEYGLPCAKKISARIAWIKASETVDEIMQGPGQCHPLKGHYYKDCYSIRLHGALRMIFRLMTAEERKDQSVPDGASALIIEIVNYHPG